MDDENDELTDSGIELLLEDARLGDTVASVTLVEACERAIAADATAEEAVSAREHIREYLRGARRRSATADATAVHEPSDRRIGDGGIVACGDLMHDGTCHATESGPCAVSRRLCGECAASQADHESDVAYEQRRLGCGEVLESRDEGLADEELVEPPPGWEERAVERARREGVI